MELLETSCPRFKDPILETIATFLWSIGIPVEARDLAESTFFPGMKIEFGAVILDEERILHPGDVLHEAGHLAVVNEGERSALNGDAGPSGASEMSALAWSYAACVHLKLAPSVVFHKESYGGGGDQMVRNFSEKCYIGLPALQWYGMTADEKHAAKLGVPPYPFMLRWLR
jgi:hypothetical protein